MPLMDAKTKDDGSGAVVAKVNICPLSFRPSETTDNEVIGPEKWMIPL